jgi:hypothetical protein
MFLSRELFRGCLTRLRDAVTLGDTQERLANDAKVAHEGIGVDVSDIELQLFLPTDIVPAIDLR